MFSFKIKFLSLFSFFASITISLCQDVRTVSRDANLAPNLSLGAGQTSSGGVGLSVDYFSGQLQASIPLIQTGNPIFSFGLNYKAGGFKTETQPGVVGLGWNISIGGGIFRNVNGLPDEIEKTFEDDVFSQSLYQNDPDLLFQRNENFSPIRPSGSSNIGSYNPNKLKNNQNQFIDLQAKDRFLEKAAMNEIDINYDEFTIAAPGVSGSFFMQKGGAGYQNFTIQWLSEPVGEILPIYDSRLELVGYQPNNLNGFNLKLPNGTIYKFRKIVSQKFSVSTKTTTHRFTAPTTDLPITTDKQLSEHKIGWLLTSIITPDLENIEYDYEPSTSSVRSPFAYQQYIARPFLNFLWTYLVSSTITCPPSTAPSPNYIPATGGFYPLSSYTLDFGTETGNDDITLPDVVTVEGTNITITNSFLLKRISTRGLLAEFTYSTHPATQSFFGEIKLIQSIYLKNLENQSFQKVLFKYHNLSTNPSEITSGPLSGFPLLSTISFLSNKSNQKPINLDYHYTASIDGVTSSFPIDIQTARQIDRFGFFNGKAKTTLIFNQNDNHSCNFEGGRLGMLKKISQDFLISEIVYQQNQVTNNSNGQLVVVGGVRVKSISNKRANETPKITQFRYGDNLLPNGEPMGLENETTALGENGGGRELYSTVFNFTKDPFHKLQRVAYVGVNYDLSFEKCIEYDFISSRPIIPFEDQLGRSVYYPRVDVINPDGSFVLNVFNPPTLKNNNSVQTIGWGFEISEQNGECSVNTNTWSSNNYFGESNIERYSKFICLPAQQALPTEHPMLKSYLPTKLGGELLEQKVFRKDGQALQIIKNRYKTVLGPALKEIKIEAFWNISYSTLVPPSYGDWNFLHTYNNQAIRNSGFLVRIDEERPFLVLDRSEIIQYNYKGAALNLKLKTVEETQFKEETIVGGPQAFNTTFRGRIATSISETWVEKNGSFLLVKDRKLKTQFRYLDEVLGSTWNSYATNNIEAGANGYEKAILFYRKHKIIPPLVEKVESFAESGVVRSVSLELPFAYPFNGNYVVSSKEELQFHPAKTGQTALKAENCSSGQNCYQFLSFSGTGDNPYQWDPDNFKIKRSVLSVNSKGLCTSFTDDSKKVSTTLYTNNGVQPVCSVVNASPEEIGYSSFEYQDKDGNDDLGWSVYLSPIQGQTFGLCHYQNEGLTGSKSISLDYSFGPTKSISIKNAKHKNYTFSVWLRKKNTEDTRNCGTIKLQAYIHDGPSDFDAVGQGLVWNLDVTDVGTEWKRYELKIPLSTSTINLSDPYLRVYTLSPKSTFTDQASLQSALVDECRLFPVEALVKTEAMDEFTQSKTTIDTKGRLIKQSLENEAAVERNVSGDIIQINSSTVK